MAEQWRKHSPESNQTADQSVDMQLDSSSSQWPKVALIVAQIRSAIICIGSTVVQWSALLYWASHYLAVNIRPTATLSNTLRSIADVRPEVTLTSWSLT